MESKILIDINYSSRDPQILIQYKESEDPRDKLIAMLTGHAMPGVQDGYCRIERSHSHGGTDFIVITPLSPEDALKHIPSIKRFALESNVVDKATAFKAWEGQIVDSMNEMCMASLPPDLFNAWKQVEDVLRNNRHLLKETE